MFIQFTASFRKNGETILVPQNSILMYFVGVWTQEVLSKFKDLLGL